jgi:hypothetical protein
MDSDRISHKNHSIYEDHPPQGLSEARRGREVFLKFSVTDPPQRKPRRGRRRLS